MKMWAVYLLLVCPLGFKGEIDSGLTLHSKNRAELNYEMHKKAMELDIPLMLNSNKYSDKPAEWCKVLNIRMEEKTCDNPEHQIDAQ